MADAATDMTDEWIMSVIDKNPCTKLDSGNLRCTPARLSFPHLFKPQPPLEDGGRANYCATLLFPFLADLTLLKSEAQALAQSKLAPGDTGKGIHSPFKDQGDKEKFEGYVPGALCITATSERRPPVVDRTFVPIIDESKVYPGVWVIATVRPFWFDVKNKQGSTLKRGIGFGLQSLMVVADDRQLGGGGSDPHKDFAGVQGFGDMSNATQPTSMF